MLTKLWQTDLKQEELMLKQHKRASVLTVLCERELEQDFLMKARCSVKLEHEANQRPLWIAKDDYRSRIPAHCPQGYDQP